jgi:L-seryl-tRNA(Ser) seleniumtransferase
VEDLARVTREAGIPLLHDLGSGALLDMENLGLPHEPTGREALEAGADVVTMSGDKLLGGPQAGIILGGRSLVAAMRRNPLCRAVRPDKLTLAALAATLILYLEPERAIRDVPVLRMLAESEESMRERAAELSGRLRSAGVEAEPVQTSTAVGGGAYPGIELTGWAVAVGGESNVELLARRLREGRPAVVGRIRNGRLLLELRTIVPDELDVLVRALEQAVGRRD